MTSKEVDINYIEKKVFTTSIPYENLENFSTHVKNTLKSTFYSKPLYKREKAIQNAYQRLYSLGSNIRKEEYDTFVEKYFFDRKINNVETIHAILGIISETKELFYCFFNGLFYKKNITVSTDILSEIGDILWYTVHMLNSLKYEINKIKDSYYEIKNIREQDILNLYYSENNILNIEKEDLQRIRKQIFIEKESDVSIDIIPDATFIAMEKLLESVNSLFHSYMKDLELSIINNCMNIINSLILLAFGLGTDLSRIMEENIEKLSKRQ